MKLRNLSVLAVLFVALASITVPAVSDAPDAEEHCVARVGEGESDRLRCFSTFADAIYFATDGRVRLDPDIQPNELTQGMLDEGQSQSSGRTQAAALQQNVIGIGYAREGYNGSSIGWTVDGDGFRDFPELGISMIRAEWNDRISSSRSFAGCRTMRHYEHSQYGGAVRDCTPDCPGLGVLNNETSSLKWFR